MHEGEVIAGGEFADLLEIGPPLGGACVTTRPSTLWSSWPRPLSRNRAALRASAQVQDEVGIGVIGDVLGDVHGAGAAHVSVDAAAAGDREGQCLAAEDVGGVEEPFAGDPSAGQDEVCRAD